MGSEAHVMLTLVQLTILRESTLCVYVVVLRPSHQHKLLCDTAQEMKGSRDAERILARKMPLINP
eukprot:COSAG02_NODE_45461_length_357_cov_0.589147_1_plen_64_part_01